MYLKIIIKSMLCAVFAFLLTFYLRRAREKYAQTVLQQHRPPNPEEPLPPSYSPLLAFPQAAICSDNNACSIIARKILERGGSVVDSALSSLLCNGLLGMQSMGLGGGMLMNIYIHNERRSYSILSREISPMSLHAANFTVFRNEDHLKQSSWSIAVPTELMGYALAHERFGKLPWREIVEPTIEICRKGYRLYKHQYDALLINEEMVRSDTLLSQLFVKPSTGEFWNIGTHLYPPEQLCDTYAHIAKEGPRSFYKGSLGKMVHDDLLEMKSVITENDLNAAHARLRESIVVPLDEYDLHLTPLPGSGYVLGFIMNILLQYRKEFQQKRHLGPLEIHRIVEAMKFGFVKRWQLDESVDEGLLDNMTSSAYAEEIAKLIDDSRTFDEPMNYGATSEVHSRPEYGTSHISVLSKDDAVSVTSSINFYFGSGRMGKRTGVLFNNAMTDFSIERLKNHFNLPFVPNKNMITAGATPMSSMTPVIVTERSTGKVRLVVGAAGGTKIISSLVPVLIRTLWQQVNIKGAIDAYRVHHQMLPNVLEYEYGLLQSHLVELESKGHQCQRYLNRGSVICGIEQTNETIFVNSDFRKMGGVTGY
ncbi:glutathione hydrolase 1 proenzyme [Scaptodrosophila lebanonensis]|uniref:Glutathione hydrolase 1 proenzyme n=1 Tax=Drosophila lebanonensis TaxID=7225 RepID=A0A6J2TXF4_DROLE|nr:glutathione hydrolase 1 proenzyme [Scaptodrosophila lebanonensis]